MSAICLRNAAKLSLLLCCLMSAEAKPRSASTVDGFVTAVSPSGFEVGALHVALAKDARCEVREAKIASQIPLYKYYFLGRSLYARSPASAVPCATLPVQTGSNLHLEGMLQPDGRNFLASRVAVYRLSRVGLFEGGALVEIGSSTRLKEGRSSAIWVSGRLLKVTPQTRMVALPSDTTVGFSVHRFVLTVRGKVNPASPERAFSSSFIRPNTWVIYRAAASQHGGAAASKLWLWPNRTSVAEARYLKQFPTRIGAGAASAFPSSIQLKHGPAIDVLSDRSVQAWVSSIGSALVPQYQRNLPDSDATKIHFQFYVVRSYRAPFRSGLIDINGVLPVLGSSGGADYHNPAIFTQVRDVISLPSGIVLVPDRVLVSLQNKAQLAALLSCSITSVLQKRAYLARHHSRTRGYFPTLWLRLNEQTLRIGIRQMYLAGYDIREAPYAWAVAEGKPADNPVIDSRYPTRAIPWYAIYAFNYIRQYYSKADFSKLKRGEAEYAQLLDELRKADPEAFEQKK